MSRDVDARDLIVAKRLSMHPDRYVHDVLQAIAAKQLIRAGTEVSGGQTVRYLITDAKNRRLNSRVKIAELVNAETPFDAERYVDMLIRAGANILSPFGYNERMLKNRLVYGERQMILAPLAQQ